MPGPYTFVLSVGTLTTTVTATAIAPPPGTIFTLVNALRRTGVTSSPTAGSIARLIRPDGLARDGDGTLYFSERGHDACGIYALSPVGIVSRVAGSGPCWTGQGARLPSGNYVLPTAGPALASPLGHPTGLAIDVARRRLYVAETRPGQLGRSEANSYVKVLNLANGMLSVFAGGGAPFRGAGPPWPTSPPTPVAPTSIAFLDGFGALDLWVAPDGALFIQDERRILRVDQATGLIGWWSHPEANYFARDNSVELDGFVAPWGGVRFDSQGTPVVSGAFSANGARYVVARGQPGAFAGLVGGGADIADGPAGQQYVAQATATPIAVDTSDDVYYAESRVHVIRRVDHLTGNVTTIVGDRRPGFGGDYGPAAQATIHSPGQMLVTPEGHLVFVDSGNAAIRIVW